MNQRDDRMKIAAQTKSNTEHHEPPKESNYSQLMQKDRHVIQSSADQRIDRRPEPNRGYMKPERQGVDPTPIQGRSGIT